MKFPIKTCLACGLDLTTAEPAEANGPGEAPSVGTCPQCSTPYFLVEDSASLSDEPATEPEPEAEKPKKGKGKGKTEPEPEPETEASAEPEAKVEAEAEPVTEPEPAPEPAPEPEE